MERRKTTLKGGHPISVLLKTNFRDINAYLLSEFKTIGAYTQATYKEYLEQHSNEETLEIC